MSGYNMVRKVKHLEEECLRLGFIMCHATHYSREYGDVVAVKPREDCLPIYSRDAEVFVGTLDALEYWIMGIEWARKYDRMLFDSKNDLKRTRKEQDYRNKRLLKIIKDGEMPNEQSLKNDR